MPRPSTPSVRGGPRPVGPTSPPQTPTSASPVSNRKKKPNERANPLQSFSRPPQHVPNGRSADDRVNGIRPGQLSPGLSESSDESEASSSRSLSPPRSLSSAQSDDRAPSPPIPRATTHRIIVETTWTVEELSDFDSEDGRRPVLRPHAIEYADSDRSRSRSRNPSEVDRGVISRFQDLSCGSESDEPDFEEAEYKQFRAKNREEKRRKRLNSGSIGKRTISESIGSGSDREDIRAALLDAAEAGSSARRLRRRVGDRRSLQFQDPPPSRIDELEEPETSDDEMEEVNEALAKELPYYTLEYISMEVDSS